MSDSGEDVVMVSMAESSVLTANFDLRLAETRGKLEELFFTADVWFGPAQPFKAGCFVDLDAPPLDLKKKKEAKMQINKLNKTQR